MYWRVRAGLWAPTTPGTRLGSGSSPARAAPGTAAEREAAPARRCRRVRLRSDAKSLLRLAGERPADLRYAELRCAGLRGSWSQLGSRVDTARAGSLSIFRVTANGSS